MANRLLESIQSNTAPSNNRLLSNIQSTGNRIDIASIVKSQTPTPASIPSPVEQPVDNSSWLDKLKEFVFPTRGQSEESISSAQPTLKESLTGSAKFIGELVSGLGSLPSIATSFVERKLGNTGTADYLDKLRQESAIGKLAELSKPSTPGEAKVMRAGDVITLVPGLIKKSVTTALIKASTKDAVLGTLKKEGLSVTDDIAEQIAKETDSKKISTLLNNANLESGLQEDIGRIALDKARRSVAAVEQPSKIASIKETVSGIPGKIQEFFTTRFAPIQKFANEELRNAGVVVKEKNSLIKEFENYSSDRAAAAAKVNEFKTRVIDPANKDGLRDALKEYLFMRRNKTRVAAGIKTGDWTVASADAGIDALKKELGDEKFAKVEILATRIQESADEALRTLVDSGVISKEGYAAIKKSNDFYAPFKLLKYIGDEDYIGGAGKSINLSKQDVVKAMKGISTNEIRIADPIDEVAKKIYQAGLTSAKNRIMKKFAELADLKDSSIKKLSSAEKKSTPDKGMDLVHYMDDGKVKILEVPKEVARAIRGLNAEAIGVIANSMRYAMIPTRAGITTLNVGFQAANLLVDLARVATISKFRIKNPVDAGKFVYDYGKSLISSFGGNFDDIISKLTKGMIKTKGDEYRAAEASGVFSGTVYNSYLKEFGKSSGPISSKIHHVFDIFDKLGNSIEEASKLAGYNRGLRLVKEGKMSHSDLLYEVRNYAGSPDFSRGGTITPEANILFMFFNARIQGISSDLRRLSGYSDGGKEAMKAAGTLGSLVALPVTLNSIRNNSQYKDDIDKLTDWEKANNIIIFKDSFIKDKNGEYVRDADGNPVRDAWKIPVRDTIGAVKNLTETIVESAYQDESIGKKMIAFATSTLEGFSPVNIQGDTLEERGQSIVASLNPLLKAFYEVTSGVDPYKHKKIEPDYLGGEVTADLPKELRKKDSTPDWAIQLGELTGQSPLIIEKIANDFGAGVFTQFQGTDQRGNALSKRFIRSVYYRENEEFVKELENLKQQDAVKGIGEYSKAKVIYESIKEMGPEEKKRTMRELIQSGVIDENVAKEIVKFYEKSQFGYSKEDSLLRDLSVEDGTRAKAIYKKLQTLDDNKKKQYIASAIEKKIITDKVASQLTFLMSQ